jgi:hypothetical protein
MIKLTAAAECGILAAAHSMALLRDKMEEVLKSNENAVVKALNIAHLQMLFKHGQKMIMDDIIDKLKVDEAKAEMFADICDKADGKEETPEEIKVQQFSTPAELLQFMQSKANG